jgi:hypothetical protein
MGAKPMTAVRWRKATDPQAMLEFLGKRASDRKLRLFACACCWRAWHLAKTPRLRQALPLIEEFADGAVKDRDRGRAQGLCNQVLNASGLGASQKCLGAELWKASKKKLNRRDHNFYNMGEFAASAIAHATDEYDTEWTAAQKAERKEQASLIRELFGKPFRRATFNRAWRTSDVMLLAKGIYEERAFDRMPILADALQDAGCDSDDTLNHLRDPHATHVRGCWALDLVLDKE